MTARPLYEKAWKQLADTQVAYEPPAVELPPLDLYRRKTSEWQPVRFLGEPIRFAADKPLPANTQHVLASFMDEVEADLTIDVPLESAAPPVAVRSLAPAPGPEGVTSCAGARLALSEKEAAHG